MKEVTLVRPSLAELPGYIAALDKGWYPDNVRKAEAAREHLEKIANNAAGFLESLDDPDAKGDPVRSPDGSLAPRLPGFTRWIWDGEFCGSIGFRWQRGTYALPEHVLGHIGFAVVPWKRGAGYAKQALALMLPEARKRGLTHVDLTTDPSQHCLAESDCCLRRQAGGALHEIRSMWRRRRSAVSNRAGKHRRRSMMEGPLPTLGGW